MKHMIAIAILSICLVSCVAASAPGGRQCSSNGVCIKIQVAGPMRTNEPVIVTATITSNKDFSNVEVAFFSDAPDLLIEDKQIWQKGTRGEKIDVKANQSVVVSRRILFPSEREFNLMVSAMTSTFRVEDSVYVITTKDGGKIYPAGELIPTAPFRRLPTLPPREAPKGPLTPPSILGTAAPPLGKSITPVIPTAVPPTRVLIPPTPTGRAYP